LRARGVPGDAAGVFFGLRMIGITHWYIVIYVAMAYSARYNRPKSALSPKKSRLVQGKVNDSVD
jgi:hypothetical protein